MSQEPEKRTKINECYRCAFRQNVPGESHIKCANPDTEMAGNPHGIKNGWFIYPLLFDPTWKEKDCANYEPKDVAVSESVSVAGESK